MTSLSIKIDLGDKTRVYRFSEAMHVKEACEEIMDNTGMGDETFGLFQPKGRNTKNARWLNPAKTFRFFSIGNGDVLEFRSHARPVKVSLTDGTKKTIMINDSALVEEIIDIIGSRIGLVNSEEYGLKKNEASKKWLLPNFTLQEQGVETTDVLAFEKRFFVDDMSVNTTDPTQLHMIYSQSRDKILDGSYPTKLEEATKFGALQLQVQAGDYTPSKHTNSWIRGEDVIPAQYKKAGIYEAMLVKEWRAQVRVNELNAKMKYVQLCRSLPTYGITFFTVREKVPKKLKLQEVMLGITRDQVVRMDVNTKAVLSQRPLKFVRRWAAGKDSFTIDYGVYQNDYYTVQTKEAEDISQLLSGYIDILLKRQREGRLRIEEDEGEVAKIEVLGPISGVANEATISQVGVGRYSPEELRDLDLMPSLQMHGEGDSRMVPASFEVSDWGDASDAINKMANQSDPVYEHDEDEEDPLPVELKDRFVSHASNIGRAVSDIVSGNPTTDAQNITDQLADMLKAARLAAGATEDISLLEAAKKVSHAVADILKTVHDLEDDPESVPLRSNLTRHLHALKSAGSLTTQAMTAELADAPSQQLIMEAALQAAQALKAFTDEAGAHPQVHAAAKLAEGLPERAKNMAPLLVNPKECEMIMADIENIRQATRQAFTEVKSSAQHPERLMATAKEAYATLVQMKNCATTASAQAAKNEEELQHAAANLSTPLEQLKYSGGDAQKVENASQDLRKALPSFITAVKHMAQANPQEAKELLLEAREMASACTQVLRNARAVQQAPKQAAEPVPEPVSLLMPNLEDLMTASRAYASGPADDADISLLQAAKKVNNQIKGLLGTSRGAAAVEGEEPPLLTFKPALQDILKCARAYARNPEQDANARLLEAARKLSEAVNDMLASAEGAQYPEAVKLLEPELDAFLEAVEEGAEVRVLDASERVKESVQILLETGDPRELGKLVDPLAELEVCTEELHELREVSGPQAREVLEDAVNAAQAIKALIRADRADPMAEMLASIKAVETSTKTILGADGEKFALFNAVRSKVKQALASSLGLTNTTRAAVREVRDRGTADRLAGDTQRAQDESRKLVKALAAAAQAPDDWDAQAELVRVARATAKPLANMVNASRECIPAISSHATKQTLKYATGEAGSAITDLVNACRAAGVLTGEEDVDAANQALLLAEQQLDNVSTTSGDDADLKDELASVMAAVAALQDGKNASAEATAAAQRLAEAAALSRNQQAVQYTKELLPDLSALIAASKAHAQSSSGDSEVSLLEAVHKVNKSVSTMLNTDEREASAGDALEAQTVVQDALRTLILKPKYKRGGDVLVQGGDVEKRADALQQACVRVRNLALDKGASREDLDGAMSATAFAFPTVINAVNQVAQSIKDPVAQQAIIQAAQVLGAHVGKVLSNAPAAQVDQRAREGLERAVVGVDDAVRSLHAAMQQATPGLEDLERAISMLQDTLNGTSELSSGDKASVRQLPAATNRLGDAAVGIIRAARVEPEALGAKSVEAVRCLSAVVDVARGINPSVEKLACAVALRSHVVAVENAANTRQASAEAKSLVQGMPAFMQLVKELSGETDATTTKALRNAAKLVRPALSSLKEATAEGDLASLQRASAQVGNALDSILCAAPQGEQASRLVLGCALLGAPVAGMARVAGSLAAKPGNDKLLAQLTREGKGVGAGVKNFRDVIKSLTPGTVECERAVKEISASIEVLDEAAMDAAVGILDVVPQQSHQAAQENMVTVVRALASLIQRAVEHVKSSDYVALSQCASEVALNIAQVKSTALQVAGTTTNQSVQTNHLTLAKALADSTLGFMRVTSDLTLDHSDVSLKKNLAAHAGDIRSNIQDLLKSLKGGVVGLRACDEATEQIKACKDLVGASAKKKQKRSGNYGEAQKALIESARALAVDSTQLFHTARTEPQGVGDPSKALADSLEQLMQGAQNAAASAEDPAISKLLTVGALDLCEGALQLVLSAKMVATDPGNGVSVEALGRSFQTLTDRVTGLIRSVKEGATGERECREAAAAVRKAVSDLDTAAVSAATGQFRVQTKQTLDMVQTELLEAANDISSVAARLVDSVDESQTSLGAAAQSLAQAFGKLAINTKLVAGITSDVAVQSDVLLGAKRLGLETAGAIMTALQAQSKQGDRKLSEGLSARFDAIEEGVEDIVGSVSSRVAPAVEGIRAATTAQKSLAKKLDWLVDEDFKSKGGSTPQDLPEPLREVLACVNEYFLGCTSTDGAEFQTQVARLEKAVSRVIKHSGGALKASKKSDVHRGLKYAVKHLVTDAVLLLQHLKYQHKDEDKYQDTLLTMGDTMAKKVDAVISAASLVPGGEDLELKESTLENQASNELMSAASEIREAAKLLMSVQSVESVDMDDDDLSASILAQAQIIMEATMELMQAAMAAQQEINKSATTSGSTYRDEDFSQGLMSSAKLVALTAKDLVSAANLVVKGELSEDAIVATSRTVGGATARLVAAAKSKLASGSPLQTKLADAASKITVATKDLARDAESAIAAAVAEEEELKASKMTAFALRAAKLDEQEAVNSLQRNLDGAYRRLKLARKKEYEEAQKKLAQQQKSVSKAPQIVNRQSVRPTHKKDKKRRK